MTAHPLDPLSADELRAAVELLRRECAVGEHDRIVTVTLAEPPKAAVLVGEATGREAFAVVFDPASGETREAVLSLTSETVVSWRLVPGVQPAFTLGEVEEATAAVKADAGFREALAARGVTDLELVHVEIWPFGDLAPEEERELRLGWTPVWIRHDREDNPYAHPVRGLHAVVDLRAMRGRPDRGSRRRADPGRRPGTTPPPRSGRFATT